MFETLQLQTSNSGTCFLTGVSMPVVLGISQSDLSIQTDTSGNWGSGDVWATQWL